MSGVWQSCCLNWSWLIMTKMHWLGLFHQIFTPLLSNALMLVTHCSRHLTIHSVLHNAPYLHLFDVWSSGLLSGWPQWPRTCYQNFMWSDTFLWQFPAWFNNFCVLSLLVHTMHYRLSDYVLYKFTINIDIVTEAIPTMSVSSSFR